METLKYTAFNLVRHGTVLTNAYVTSDVIGPKPQVNPTDQNQLMLYTFIKLGGLTEIDLIVEFSSDKINWVQETIDQPAITGIITEVLATRKFVADGGYRIAIPIKDQYIRLKYKGNNAGGTLGVDVIEGTA